MTQSSSNDKPLLDADDLAKLLGVNRRTIQQYVAAGVLPRPIKLSQKVVRWPRRAIEEAFGLASK